MSQKTVTDDDIAKLIKFVEMYPCLYNPNSPDYRDPQKVNEVWQHISNLMGKKDIDWKTKWRTKRDLYVRKKRFLRNNEGDEAVKKIKNWHFTKSLSFLDEYIEPRNVDYLTPSKLDSNSNGFSSTSGDEETHGLIGEFDYIYPNVKVESDVSNNDAACDGETNDVLIRPEPTLPCSLLQPVTKIKTSFDVNNSQGADDAKGYQEEHMESSAEFLKAEAVAHDLMTEEESVKKNVANKLRDLFVQKTPEDVFFDSCALRIKKLPPIIRSYVQLQISQVFLNAENPHLDPLPITPLPPALGNSNR